MNSHQILFDKVLSTMITVKNIGHLNDHLKICTYNSAYVQTLRQELLDCKQEITVLIQKDKKLWINQS